MQYLVKQITIIDPSSSFHQSVADILIEHGEIKLIDKQISPHANTQVIEANNLVATPGWIDIFSFVGEPGFEYRETFDTLIEAANSGGYTTLLTLPNTKPIIQQKSLVQYVKQQALAKPISLYPIGAATRNIEGTEIADLWEMFNAGCVAFSDAEKPIQQPALMLKLLQYAKAFNCPIVQIPLDASLSKYGLMHEGIVSTQLGLPGVPSMAEVIALKRDIELLRYSQSKLHVTGVSTKQAIQIIKEAKQDGLNITCSVSPFHLTATDEDLVTYDTNLKLLPVLRSQHDREALIQAVLDGVVDCIASHHCPQHIDAKQCEFEAAKPGMISLQTTYSMLQTAIPQLTPQHIYNLLYKNPQQIFNLPQASININQPANLTLFQPSQKFTLTMAENKSKSNNFAYFNTPFTGKVFGVMHKNQIHIN